MTKENYKELLLEACKLANETMLKMRKDNTAHESMKFKSAAVVSIVTAADEETERVLKKFFNEKLPEFNILGEEFGAINDKTEKVIVIDPIDCTFGYANGRDNFGPIIGIYENGINVASLECNAATGTIYVATKDNDFERIGPEDNVNKGVIYFAGELTKYANDAVYKKLEELFPEHHKNGKIIISPQDTQKVHQNVLNKVRVCAGDHDAFIHTGLSRHDLAATPLFCKKTGMIVTDHRGNSIEPADFKNEFRKYSIKNDENVIYSMPVIITKPEIHKKILEALEPIADVLDKVQNPEF